MTIVARWVVAVEHGGLLDSLVRAGGGEIDQASLRFEVVLPGRVVVHVVVTYVGEGCNVEVARAHPVLHERVRGGLDDSAFDARVRHAPKPFLHLRGLSRRLPAPGGG